MMKGIRTSRKVRKQKSFEDSCDSILTTEALFHYCISCKSYNGFMPFLDFYYAFSSGWLFDNFLFEMKAICFCRSLN